MDKPVIGIFGATGAVGREMIKVIQAKNLALKELRLFASARSVGQTIETKYGQLEVNDANTVDYSQLDIALLAIGGAWSEKNAQKIIDAGCVVIDNSSHFRYQDDVPLVIPEINIQTIDQAKLIANPNCTTAIAAIPLWVIHQQYKLKRVLVSTYQAASGAGKVGMDELMTGLTEALNGKKIKPKVFQHPLPFNVIPHIDKFQDNGYTKEEMKVVWELQKIFDDHSINVSCTAVRVPTLRAHAESIVVETEKVIDAATVKELFENTPGLRLIDDPKTNTYPMPYTATGEYDVEVGRLRQSLVFGNHGLEFFVCGDQLLKGAALNAVQIAEAVIDRQK